MSFPPYAEYKDSGVAWLGVVPGHWEVTRLKQACDVFPSNVDKKSVDGEAAVRLCNYTDVYYNERISDDFPFMEATATDDQIARFTLLAGDTIITKDSETPDDIARSAYVPETLKGVICGYHLSMVRPREVTCGAFIKRYFDTPSARAYFHVSANGLTRVGLGQYALDNAPIALPPLAEQEAIAGFLDREVGKIDGLVAEQERLIALLKEKRQAVISHAVTKGLNPNAPLKDSGIEWLGQIPEHWEVVKAVRYFRASKGKEGQLLTKEYCAENAGDYPVYSGQTENEGVMGTLDRYEFDSGDEGYLFSTTVGAKAMTVGHIFGKFSLSQNCMIIRPVDDVVHSRFYYYHFQPVFSYHRSLIPDHMQPSFRMEDLYSFSVALPPDGEQMSIASYLDEKLAGYRELESEAQSAITLLQERRAALISAAVTGKIDVRAAAAPTIAAMEPA